MEYLKSASLEMVESRGFAPKAGTARFKQMQNDTCILTSGDETGIFSVLKAMIFFLAWVIFLMVHHCLGLCS